MTLGVAVIGMGFMGRTHVRAYRNAGAACRLVGVHDLNPERLEPDAKRDGNIPSETAGEVLFDRAEVFATDSLDALLDREDIDAVSVCTPTDSHTDVALAALRAGKHVLVEKPVSLYRSDIEMLAGEAERAGRCCMPAMCMRFWPEWTWLAERVHDLTLGHPRGFSFERIGSAPTWGEGFYREPNRCGGALYDLHIHDTDFVCHVLGVPRAVTSVGDRDRMTTLYHYENRPGHVVASGGWPRGGLDFRMRFIAEFESATADFDLARKPALLLGREGEQRPVSVSPATGYDGQVLAFIEAISTGSKPPVTLCDASTTLAVLDAEARSMESGLRQTITA